MTRPVPFPIAAAIVDAVEHRRDLPRMEADRYRDRGWHVVQPGTAAGSALGFHGRDWHRSSFLAIDESVVEIALLEAKRPGTGAFGRLRDALEARGLRVVIVCPTGRFRDALARAGYQCTTVGSTFEDRRDLWSRP